MNFFSFKKTQNWFLFRVAGPTWISEKGYLFISIVCVCRNAIISVDVIQCVTHIQNTQENEWINYIVVIACCRYKKPATHVQRTTFTFGCFCHMWPAEMRQKRWTNQKSVYIVIIRTFTAPRQNTLNRREKQETKQKQQKIARSRFDRNISMEFCMRDFHITARRDFISKVKMEMNAWFTPIFTHICNALWIPFHIFFAFAVASCSFSLQYFCELRQFVLFLGSFNL